MMNQVSQGPIANAASRPSSMLDEVTRSGNGHTDRVLSIAGRVCAIADDLLGAAPPSGANGQVPQVPPGQVPKLTQAMQSQRRLEEALDILSAQIDRLTAL